jgi:hypothetical protein
MVGCPAARPWVIALLAPALEDTSRFKDVRRVVLSAQGKRVITRNRFLKTVVPFLRSLRDPDPPPGSAASERP